VNEGEHQVAGKQKTKNGQRTQTVMNNGEQQRTTANPNKTKGSVGDPWRTLVMNGERRRAQVNRLEQGEPGEPNQNEKAGPNRSNRLSRGWSYNPMWAAGSLARKLAIRVAVLCVTLGVTHGLPAMMWNLTWDRRLDAAQAKALRMVQRTRSPYASTFLGDVPVPQAEVARSAGVRPLSAQVGP